MGHVYEGLSELFNDLTAILGLGHQHVVVDDRMRQRVVERALSDQHLMAKTEILDAMFNKAYNSPKTHIHYTLYSSR